MVGCTGEIMSVSFVYVVVVVVCNSNVWKRHHNSRSQYILYICQGCCLISKVQIPLFSWEYIFLLIFRILNEATSLSIGNLLFILWEQVSIYCYRYRPTSTHSKLFCMHLCTTTSSKFMDNLIRFLSKSSRFWSDNCQSKSRTTDLLSKSDFDLIHIIARASQGWQICCPKAWGEGGYSHVKAYRYMLTKWVSFSSKILRQGSHFSKKNP